MKLFKKLRTRSISTDLAEIHQYTLNLERITLLRDKSRTAKERDDYNATIHVMQQVLIHLNEAIVRQ